MLSITGKPYHLCDGISRRSFLSIGGLALGGMSLPGILKAEAQSGLKNSHKAIIMIYLPGGPPHQDLFDLKPDAPENIRGEFRSISTSVPGIRICEHLPKLAAMMDKLVPIRSLIGSSGRHSSFQCVTGREFGRQPLGGWPEIGSIVSKLRGPTDPAVPPTVDLSMKMAHAPYNLPGSGFLGKAHAPFKPDGDAKKDMTLNGVSLQRLDDRKALLSSFDRFRRNVDSSGMMDAVDSFTQQAFDLLTSSRLLEALDLSREDPKTRARYGKDNTKVLPYSNLGYQAIMSKFLLARRLVEAGARCVTVAFADFDWHGSNFSHGRKVLPLLDQGVSALVDDLHARGLDKDVSVVVWGEFGRTPKINKSAGRDHWPNVTCALLAGGGMRTGHVIGTTNRLAEVVKDRPVHFQEVFATLYRNLGIDAGNTKIVDLNGRPRYLVDQYSPMDELT